MSEFTGWHPDMEPEGWYDKIDTMPCGVPCGDDYLPIPKGLKKPSEWQKIHRQARNDCRGHSGSTGLEICHYYATGNIVQLSPHFCYVGAQAYRGNGDWSGRVSDNGSTIAGGMRLIMEVGICPEETMPYNRRQFTTNVSPVQKLAAEPFKAKSYRRLQSPREVRQWLESGTGYVDAGVPWGRGGYHAICYSEMVGDKFRFINSHGESWSGDGMHEDTERELSARFRDRYSVFIGISGQANAEPPGWNWLDDHGGMAG